jgi:uncharacterized membrane protein YbhN (UPF0104 family)
MLQPAEIEKPVAVSEIPDSGEGSSPSPLWRRWLSTIFKMLLAFGLLYYVLHKKMINFQELKRLFSSDGLGMLFLALATITLQLFICAQRLRLLLAAQNIRISYRNMLRLTYLGAFFDAFLVTSVGGDAVKAVYLARETQHGHRTMTVSTLLLDRLMGLLGLLSLTVFAALWNFRVMWEQSYFFPHDFFLALIMVTGAFFAGTALPFFTSPV